METDELLRQYAEGKRDFGFVELPEANLAQVDLSGSALYRANLAGASLEGANLAGANLRQANLAGANLRQANLHNAILRRATLTGAILDGADLTGAVLTDAMLPNGAISTAPRHRAVPLSSQASSQQPGGPRPMGTGDWMRETPYIIWAVILLWGAGYGLFGHLLELFEAAVGHWVVAGLSTVCWWWEPLTWFIPIMAAIAVFDAAGMSAFILLMTALIVLALMVTLTVALGRPWAETLQVSLLVGGLGAVVIQMGTWLFYGAEAYRGGGIVLNFDTLHLGLMLLFAVGLTGLGAIAWQHLLVEGVRKEKVAMVAAGVAALGLLVGGA